MRSRSRFLLLLIAVAVVLILDITVADEPLTSPDPTSPGGSQTPEPVGNSEPIISGKSEASGESEIGSPLAQVTTGVAPVSFAGADRSHAVEGNRDPLSSDASSPGSFSLDLLLGDSPPGPATDAAAPSHESQESVDHEVDSEEEETAALASQGM
ncbi:hypothetical protein JRQ81_010992 [Phrynocephalus forsythii]|uniref:Uncharacterized protein n=1 Tax=Phrynocephalus forsythii TaxID=171643 RepID=A0A9Q1B5H1_9SAUR|nr:hypothetical protein JRQ81_010992 [Phrynocephalus forsythii]